MIERAVLLASTKNGAWPKRIWERTHVGALQEEADS